MNREFFVVGNNIEVCASAIYVALKSTLYSFQTVANLWFYIIRFDNISQCFRNASMAFFWGCSAVSIPKIQVRGEISPGNPFSSAEIEFLSSCLHSKDRISHTKCIPSAQQTTMARCNCHFRRVTLPLLVLVVLVQVHVPHFRAVSSNQAEAKPPSLSNSASVICMWKMSAYADIWSRMRHKWTRLILPWSRFWAQPDAVTRGRPPANLNVRCAKSVVIFSSSLCGQVCLHAEERYFRCIVFNSSENRFVCSDANEGRGDAVRWRNNDTKVPQVKSVFALAAAFYVMTTSKP